MGEVDRLRYPIGEPVLPASSTPEEREERLRALESLPAELRAAVRGLDDAQLDTPYRPDGWTLRQVVHHVPDSHVNAYVRFKRTVTEDVPTSQPYDEVAWAEETEARSAPVELSLALVEALHDRWATWLRGLSTEAWDRAAEYPGTGRVTLDRLLALYVWHGRHHVAHITTTRERRGW